jgi:hypothetical protein
MESSQISVSSARGGGPVLIGVVFVVAGLLSGCGDTSHRVAAATATATSSAKTHLVTICRERQREIFTIIRHGLAPEASVSKQEMERVIPESVPVMDAAVAELRRAPDGAAALRVTEHNRSSLGALLRELRRRSGTAFSDLPPDAFKRLFHADTICIEG